MSDDLFAHGRMTVAAEVLAGIAEKREVERGERRAKVASSMDMRKTADRMIAQEWAALGVDPKDVSDYPVSPSLARRLGRLRPTQGENR